MNDKKDITITNTFQKIMDKSGLKLNKTWVDHGSEFCDRSLKSWLHDNGFETYSRHSKGKSAVTEYLLKP